MCYYVNVVFWLRNTQSQDNFSFIVPFLIIKISKKAQFSELFYFRHCSTRQGVKKEEFLDKAASTQSFFITPPFKLVNLFPGVALCRWQDRAVAACRDLHPKSVVQFHLLQPKLILIADIGSFFFDFKK